MYLKSKTVVMAMLLRTIKCTAAVAMLNNVPINRSRKFTLHLMS